MGSGRRGEFYFWTVRRGRNGYKTLTDFNPRSVGSGRRGEFLLPSRNKGSINRRRETTYK